MDRPKERAMLAGSDLGAHWLLLAAGVEALGRAVRQHISAAHLEDGKAWFFFPVDYDAAIRR